MYCDPFVDSQTDYALSFVDFGIKSCDDERALLTAKRTIERQLRRLKKIDPSTGIMEQSKDFKMDLYFQHFCGEQMHSSLDSVLK